jgi:hypothetical protein
LRSVRLRAHCHAQDALGFHEGRCAKTRESVLVAEQNVQSADVNALLAIQLLHVVRSVADASVLVDEGTASFSSQAPDSV